MDFNRIWNGMLRAMRLDKDFFEEVEHDTSYSQDALVVVILVSAISGIGAFFTNLFRGAGLFSAVIGLIVAVALSVLGYFLWVYVVQFVGTRYFKGTADIGEVQRAVGFAYSPQVLLLLGWIPCAGGIISLIAWLWSVAAGFIAIRQSLDQDDSNALLTAIISAVAVIIVLAIVRGVVHLVFPGLSTI